MRVNIDTTEKKAGLVFKSTYVQFSAKVDFTQEELHVIKRFGLDKKVLCEKPQSNIVVKRLGKHADDPAYFQLRVSSLLDSKPYTYDLDDFAQATTLKQDLTEGLKLLKQHIDHNAAGLASSGAQSDSFEL